MYYQQIPANWKPAVMAALIAVAFLRTAYAQSAPPMILEVDLENFVQYWDDLTDPTKLASVPSQVNTTGKTFMQNVWVGDVVAVNGAPARGTYITRTQSFGYRPSPSPGQTVADINRNGGPTTEILEILMTDGTPVGTVMGIGFAGGAAPPGSPAGLTLGNSAIVGGTGSFLGARGQCGVAMGSGVRNASQSEDPSLRRVYGGGKMRMVLHLMPAVRPEIVLVPDGPAVVHSADFKPVTVTAPARGGEVLSLFAKGLGPTRPNVPPGARFPTDPLAVVNAPVTVMVNWTSAEMLAAVGYPGSADAYQVNFRVPPDTQKGNATVHVSAAWIPSSSVTIPIQ